MSSTFKRGVDQMSRQFSRRSFLRSGVVTAGALAVGILPQMGGGFAAERETPQVYFTPDISFEGLVKVYSHISKQITGRIAVKLHTGEPNGPNILPRDMVKAFQKTLPQSRIVECNVLYSSPRQTTAGHRETLKANGWTFSPVDIMDEEGEVDLPVPGGKWLQRVAVGSHLLNYDSMLVLTHFKGHTMGGFGGSLKNIAIGCASGKTGKAQIHSDGNSLWARGPLFMERMVEGGKAITSYFGTHIAYINVLRNMSVSCDCEGVNAAPVRTPDLGILASTDILAIDQASIDMIYALPEEQKRDMVERIESRSGLRQLEYMEIQGMGSRAYELVVL